MKNKMIRIILCSLTITLTATFNLPIVTEGFIVSLATGILPFLLYLNHDINAFLLCFVISIMSPLFRFILLLNEVALKHALLIIWPDAVFYLIYGLLFYLIYQKNKVYEVNRLIATAFLCDFFANIIEIGVRIGFINFTYDVISQLLLVAFIRTFMLVVLIISSKYYQSFLITQSHEIRYRRLLEMGSSFKSEIYFMYKNMDRIETVMQQSFRAYKIASDHETHNDLKEILLDLSKDVHEIKKDYLRVIYGIEQSFPNLIEFSDLSIKEIVQILTQNTNEQLIKDNKNVIFESSVHGNAKIKSHFYFMSVLGNLVQNSIEATESKKNSVVSLKIIVDDNIVKIKIKDNGEGIKSEYIPYLFNPGFSTKYNSDTGDMFRGVGLTLVKSLVEEYFHGTISVESMLNEGTSFSIRISKNILEGEI